MTSHADYRSQPWTVADIGGTHARIARWSATAGLGAPLRLRNDDYHDPVDLLEAWFRRGADAPRRIVLALAMPVGADARQLTNRSWRFEPRSLAAELRLDSLVIVNDFAAAAAGIDALPADQLHPLNVGAPMSLRGVRAVLGPGTGLGCAALVGDDPPRVIASEAGHMTFGSADPIAERLNADGSARWGRVSWERVLCGDGLAWLHAAMSGRRDLGEASNVARAAAAGDERALATVGLFSRLLGEFAGDVCLAFQALDGVYLTGGVLHGLLETFDERGFLAAFSDKGRFADALRRVPVHVVAGHELGLQGAARFVAGQCRLTSVEWHA